MNGFDFRLINLLEDLPGTLMSCHVMLTRNLQVMPDRTMDSVPAIPRMDVTSARFIEH
jgi:hypothetical protein